MKLINKLFVCICCLATLLVLPRCQNAVTLVGNAETREQPKYVAVEQANICNTVLNNSRVGHIVFNQIFYSKVVAPERVELKTLNMTLNDEQISALEQFIALNRECRALRIQAFREYEFRLALTDYFEEMDLLFTDMINKGKTIAQGNSVSEQIIERYQSKIRRIIQRSRFIDEDSIG
jgi:hypothetical protein